MNILLGSIYPKSLLDELTQRNQFADYPAHIFQQSLISGLEDNLRDIKIVSSPVIKSRYSVVKDLCKRRRFSHSDKNIDTDIYVGTVPLPGLQMLVELWRVYWTIRKEFKDSRQSNRLIVYALHSPFLLTAVLLRKKTRSTCVVIPDLPEFMSQEGTIIRKLGKRLDRRIINYCLKRIDCCALLSPYMCHKLPIANKPWVLMEGIYDTSSIPTDVKKSEGRVILYTGNLSRRYGIVELLRAFQQIEKDNYQLWVCGMGEGSEDVIGASETDKRVKYLGIVSHEEVLSLQQQASVLINPRSSTGEYTKYSFPSKTMEYLASGTPTIMCHLPAIPKEYDEYIYYITDESVDGIRAKLLEVCEKADEELLAFGRKAAEFIKTEKNATVQAKKIVNLMK